MFKYSISIFNQQGNMIESRKFDSDVEPEVIKAVMVGYRVTFQQMAYADHLAVEMQVSPSLQDEEHVNNLLIGLDKVGAYTELSFEPIVTKDDESTATLTMLENNFENGLLMLEVRGRVFGLRGDMTVYFGDVASSSGPTIDELHSALRDALRVSENCRHDGELFIQMSEQIAAEIYKRWGKDGLNEIQFESVQQVMLAGQYARRHAHQHDSANVQEKTELPVKILGKEIPELKPFNPREAVERTVSEIEQIARPHGEKKKRHSAYFTLVMGKNTEVAIVMEMDEINYNRMVEESVMGLLVSNVPNGALDGSRLFCDNIPNYLAFFKSLLESNSYSIISMRPMSPASLDFDNGLTAL